MPARLRQVKLPDGTRFSCLHRSEVRLIHDSVQAYFRHGIDVSDGDIVFDVGANIGLFAHQVHRFARRNVSVYSFEPIPEIYDVLRQNAQQFGSESWTAMPYGLGRQSGTVTFGYNVRASMLSSAYPDKSPKERLRWRETVLSNLPRFPWKVRWLGWLPGFLRSPLLDVGIRKVLKTRKVTCTLRTLSEVVRELAVPRIDLLKVDVERGEMDVLAGIDAVDWPKIRQIVIEVHDLTSGRVARVQELLRRKGFARVVVEQEEILRGTDIFNLYALRTTPASASIVVAG
jgi:FkbM family methyltransferase